MREQKVTSEELRLRQGWTLEQKIDHSLGAIEQFYVFTNGKCVIMFSGGKDSTVLLHLARTIYPDIKAVFINTTNEFSEILNFVKTIDNVDTILPSTTFLTTIREFGFPLISKKVAKAIGYVKNPSPKNDKVRNLVLTGVNSSGESCKSFKLAKKWMFLADEKFDITHKCCDLLKHKPAAKYQKEHGVLPIIGTMAENSQQRKGNYLDYGCNILDGANPKSRPLSIWTDDDIWAYIKKFNVPYCDIYDKGEHNTGCAYCGFGCHLEKESRFERLQQREPKRYNQMMNLTNNGIKYEDAIKLVLNPPKKSVK
jgi:3'-phosphoadenosine 5'-phosphosulfate sulfotransferase (PAPS reductase)/FAD synthetase